MRFGDLRLACFMLRIHHVSRAIWCVTCYMMHCRLEFLWSQISAIWPRSDVTKLDRLLIICWRDKLPKLKGYSLFFFNFRTWLHECVYVSLSVCLSVSRLHDTVRSLIFVVLCPYNFIGKIWFCFVFENILFFSDSREV